MNLGINWAAIWNVAVWDTSVWQQEAAEAPETFSGGYFPYVRRKTEEDKRIERIQLGILPPDPPKPLIIQGIHGRSKYEHPQREALTLNEIRSIRAKVRNDIDLEIALHLHEIEKKRKKTLALVLILDEA